MKLWDIVKTVGSAALQTALPGTGSLIVGAVNAMLPDDKKLPESATGQQITTAISTLPPEQQAEVMNKKYDVTIEDIKQSHSTLRTMLESEAVSPHTTRPYIAKGSFLVVAFAIIVAVSIWAYGVIKSDDGIVKTVVDGWPFIVAVTGPLIVVLHSYFGVLKKEHKNRLDAANGSATPLGIAGLITSLFKKG